VITSSSGPRRPGRPRGPRFYRVLELDALGLTYRETGARLGISRQRVHQIVKRAADEARKEKGP
jgi:DNA-directed RNA polymerase specialized sigma24 family protein